MNFSRLDWVPLMAIAGGGILGAFAFGSLSSRSHQNVVVIHEVIVDAPNAVNAGTPTWSPDGRWLAVRPPIEQAETRLRLIPSHQPDAAPEPLIYVDGVRMHSRAYLEDIDPNTIDRIEIVKGAAAMQLFGPDAAGGVIQIYLKVQEAEGGADSR